MRECGKPASSKPSIQQNLCPLRTYTGSIIYYRQAANIYWQAAHQKIISIDTPGRIQNLWRHMVSSISVWIKSVWLTSHDLAYSNQSGLLSGMPWPQKDSIFLRRKWQMRGEAVNSFQAETLLSAPIPVAQFDYPSPGPAINKEAARVLTPNVGSCPSGKWKWILGCFSVGPVRVSYRKVKGDK